MFEVFKIKKIPKKNWSSDEPFNLKPRFSTFLNLCLGLFIFGLGEGLLLVSTTGNSPWSVLAEGITKLTGISIGTSTFIVSITVLSLWVFLKQKPGIGTIMNIIIIAVVDLDTLIARRAKFVRSATKTIYVPLITTRCPRLICGRGRGISGF